jgi:cytochrome oxidase Cu insertion factor (SCO1/SenC/PrrC family)
MRVSFIRILAIIVLITAVIVVPAIVQGAPASQAPAFTLDLFNGQSLKLADLKGKAVVLLFWAEW